MAVRKYQEKVSTSGSAGSATGSGIIALPPAELLKVYLDYNASAPGTTDVTLTAAGDPASEVVLTRSNSATDGYFYPRRQKDDNAAAAITGDYDKFIIHGHLLIEVAQADALTDCVIVHIWVRE